MTPHLRTFIDAIESAAGKRRADELTDIEKIAICLSAGVKVECSTVSYDGDNATTFDIITSSPVGIVHDGGNWRAIELK